MPFSFEARQSEIATVRAYRLSGLVQGLAAALVGAVLIAAPASARDGRNGALIGGAAAGLLGGVALGAALASPPPPPPPYRARPVYVEEEPVYVRPRPPAPVCHYERRKVWLDDVEFTYRRVEVCE